MIIFLIWKILDWAIFSAVFDASRGPDACHAARGACWSVIAARWRIILFGLYPFEEQWRSALACVTVVAMTVLSCIPAFWTGSRIAFIWILGSAIFYVLMKGGVFGLPYEGEEVWGGLALTLCIFVTTCLLGFPLAICLALLRRSELPWISRTTGVIIDTVRSLPLISILFTFAVVLPFTLPHWLQSDKLYRVIVGSALFFSAYQAEIIRGGMQGVPKGQEEAAMALGLNYWERISRIVLPQAMRNALPATINQFVISFKETSLVVIVGFFEILASGNAAYGTGEWRFAYVEVYVFIAFIYFVFVFSLSRYGAYLERRMSVGTR
jgi:general L-amino acid transport system permease protein